jgi:high-affinity nickel-transport protein
MLGIYSWGVIDDKRRILYNINITLLSLFSALLIGITIGLRLLGEHFGLNGGIFSIAQKISLDNVGYWLLALFVISWVIALIGLRPQTASDS